MWLAAVITATPRWGASPGGIALAFTGLAWPEGASAPLVPGPPSRARAAAIGREAAPAAAARPALALRFLRGGPRRARGSACGAVVRRGGCEEAYQSPAAAYGVSGRAGAHGACAPARGWVRPICWYPRAPASDWAGIRLYRLSMARDPTPSGR